MSVIACFRQLSLKRQSRRRKLVTVKQVALAATVLFAIFVCSQNAPKTQLSVRLTTDRASYSLHDDVQLEIVRENAGNGKVFIYRRWEWGTISKIRVFDSNGKESREVLWPIDDPPPLTSADFMLLKPGDFLRTKLKMSVKQFVSSPGDYEFFVEYRSYLSDDVARRYIRQRDVPFWSRERKTVTSNKIKLRITE
jgi:hypothetical protein